MPKMKTHSSAKKRFKLTKGGKVKRYHANHRHRLRNRSKRQKGVLCLGTLVHTSDEARMKRLLAVG